jgi:outer membrane protein assembly factor BamB
METMDVSLSNQTECVRLIIPTVMIPLTALSVALSIAASFIAGLFGITLRTEGPKRLLEVLLKPKILISGLILNLVIIGGIKGYEYVKNLPTFLWKIESTQAKIAVPSQRVYEDRRQFELMIPPGTAGGQLGEVAELWKKVLPKGNFRSPVFRGGSIFVGTDEGYVYEMDEKTGDIIRKFFIGGFITPELTIADQTLFVGEGTHETHHARVYAFDLKTGNLRGAYTTKGHTEGQPVVGEWSGEKTLLVVAGGDGIHAVDPVNLTLKWQVNDGHIDASVLPFGGKIFAGTGREKGDSEKFRTYANAYEFSTGKRIWQRELPASSWMSPVAWLESVCFVFGEVYFTSGIGGVYCFKQDDGTPTMAFNLGEPQTGIPVVVGNQLFTTSSSGKVCSLDLGTRAVSWCHEVKNKGKSFSSPSYDANLDALVYASKDDGLWILDRLTGRVIKSVGSKDWKATYGAAGIRDNLIGVGDMEGNFRVYSTL